MNKTTSREIEFYATQKYLQENKVGYLHGETFS
jgi:hypothetical protein